MVMLDETLVKAVTARTAAEVIDTNSEAQRKLEFVFGKHTFFSYEKGLFVVEPLQDAKQPNRRLVKRVRLATWADDDRKVLKPIKATSKAKKIEL